jgi:DNA-binding transcriptional ArsR family regulator
MTRSTIERQVEPRFARVAAAIGDATRAQMLSRLLDGRHYTATELAVHSGVTPPTASQHLKLLVDENLVRVRAQGRHRYFTLADGNVGHALEALLRVADGAPPETTRWYAPGMQPLRHARTCYGHLAGELGVRLCDCFVARGWVQAEAGSGHDYALTAAGADRLKQLGLASEIVFSKNNRPLYGCLDWSERRDHFAGQIAVAMLEKFVERGWLKRERDSRVLHVTIRGESEFLDALIGVKK